MKEGSTLLPLLRSDVQGRLLAEVMADSEVELSLTELATRGDTSVPTAKREIDRAERAGVVTTRRVGNTRLVRADPTHPLYAAIREIVVSTFGPPALVATEFGRIPGIEGLYLFGSWAARFQGNAGRRPADLDVLVLGHPDRDAVYDAAERLERKIKLPVEPTIRSTDVWFSDSDPFITEVRSRPLVAVLPLTGQPDAEVER